MFTPFQTHQVDLRTLWSCCLHLLKAFEGEYRKIIKYSLNDLLCAKCFNQGQVFMPFSTNLLKQPRETSLDLVNKLLSLLLEQILAPTSNHRYKNTNIHMNCPLDM